MHEGFEYDYKFNTGIHFGVKRVFLHNDTYVCTLSEHGLTSLRRSVRPASNVADLRITKMQKILCNEH